jgi:hypothetical protein
MNDILQNFTHGHLNIHQPMRLALIHHHLLEKIVLRLKITLASHEVTT